MFFKIAKVVLKILQYSQESTCAGVSFEGLQYTPIQVFPVDIAKFLRIALLYNSSGGCIWLSYHNTVKSTG